MISGTLIIESLRLNASLDRVPLSVSKITRVGPLDDLRHGQPAVWSFVEFTADQTQAGDLASSLAQVIDPALGWYCDFRSEVEIFVVFSQRVFRYRRGDAEGRARAVRHAEEVGLPHRKSIGSSSRRLVRRPRRRSAPGTTTA